MTPDEMIPVNPFNLNYTRQEIEWYGLTKLNENGIVIRTAKLEGRADEFLNKMYWCGEIEVPRFFIDRKLWMSLTPMEVQSQFISIEIAEGTVALGGLGMGYAALKIAEKDGVESIDVYEIDERVINFFKKYFSKRKGYEKITIICGDIRELLRNKMYDFAYIDIYDAYLGDEVMTDWKLFTEENCIGEYRFWMQEKVLLQGLLEEMNPYVTFFERAFFKKWLEAEGIEDTPKNQLWDKLWDNEFIEKCLVTMGRIE